MMQLILVFARQVLSADSDADGGEEVRTTVEEDARLEEAIETERRLDTWEVLEGYPLMQIFPPNTAYHLSTYCSVEELFDMARVILADQWSVKWWAALNIWEVSSLLAVEWKADGILFKRSAK